MKFLLLKTKNPRPRQPQFRIFLADGTELTDVVRIAVIGGLAQRTISLHSIDEPSPDELYFEVDKLELEFLGAEVKSIDAPPPTLADQLRALADELEVDSVASRFGLHGHQAVDDDYFMALKHAAGRIKALLGYVVGRGS